MNTTAPWAQLGIGLDEQGRPEPAGEADELGTLVSFLEFHRATLDLRCTGLDAAQLNQRLTPSTMTLAGMLKHLAFVEDFWFGYVVAEGEEGEPWASADWDADPDWDWHSAAEDSPEQLFALWIAAMDRSRAVLASALAASDDPLSVSCPRRSVSLRWVLTHMIEEYARHNGHADLIRESIDGQTGE